MKIVLEGIVGSHAYGLATSESDEDKLGIYVAKTDDILGLNKPKESIVKTNPDMTYHEVEKFIRLATKCNPTILELLFLDKYTEMTPEGQLLVDNRERFLSVIIFRSYGGYAISQARKLNRKGHFDSGLESRHSKHARHCFRLLWQGRELLETGNLNVKVKDSKKLMSIGELPVSELVETFEKEFKEFDKIETKLPPLPDYDKINKILLEIRYANLR